MADFSSDFRQAGANLFSTPEPFDFTSIFQPYVGDSNPPVVNNFVPAPGAIARQQALQLDVTDDRALAAVVILARFAAVPPSTKRPYEVVYDSEGFSDFYVTRSFITSLGGASFRFTILRDNGWPSPPRLVIIAADGLIAT